MSVYDIKPGEYNNKLAVALKQIPEFQIPEWALYVKSGVARSRPSIEEDFWHKRAASILRQIYLRGLVGVNRLRTRYGGKQNRGMKPEIFRKASGKMIRNILQQAEAAGLLEKSTGDKKGRQLTQKGKELLDSIK